MDHKNKSGRNAARFLKVFVVFLLALLGLTAGWLPSTGLYHPVSSVAKATTDPVITAAGDIACDPASSAFNNGNGTSSACRQLYTSNLLVNTGLSAVLDLGDNQYYCGSYQAYMNSYNLSWGRVLNITQPIFF